MANITTYYEYEKINNKTIGECYKVTGTVGYVKSTDTLLKQISVTDTTMDYCTAIYSVNVTGDKGESTVTFYNGEELLTFYNVTYNGSTYTISQTPQTMLEWTQNTTDTQYIAIRHNYATENNIQAKYRGNSSCLGSNSKTLTFTQEQPPTAETSINLTFNNTNRVYEPNATITVTATLNRTSSSLNANAHKGQTIKFYRDDVLVATQTATSSSSTVSTSITGTTNGIHKITAKFEGNSYLLSSESSNTVSVGYQLTISSNNEYTINNKSISVTANIKDYFDNNISGKTIYIANNSGTATSISATSNSSGNATLTIPSSNFSALTTSTSNNVQTITYKAKYSSILSESVTTLHRSGMTIEFANDEYLVAKNHTVALTGVVNGVEDLGIPIQLRVNNVVVSTDENGLFSYNYLGRGLGDTSVSATINNATATVQVEDVLQYWVANKTSYNVQYTAIEGSKIYELTNGWKITSNGVVGFIGLHDGGGLDGYSLEFTVVSSSSINTTLNEPVVSPNYTPSYTTTTSYANLDICYWDSQMSIIDLVYPSNLAVKQGDVISVTADNGVMTVSKNGVQVTQKAFSGDCPALCVQGSNSELTINNLKLKVI